MLSALLVDAGLFSHLYPGGQNCGRVGESRCVMASENALNFKGTRKESWPEWLRCCGFHPS